jgi:indole-3-glycerol phosphate synthase
VLKLDPPLIGINNRNLITFVTDLDHTLRLRPLIPDDCLLISESGIKTRADVLRLKAGGVSGILVGETLMRSDPISAKVRELLGR